VDDASGSTQCAAAARMMKGSTGGSSVGIGLDGVLEIMSPAEDQTWVWRLPWRMPTELVDEACD